MWEYSGKVVAMWRMYDYKVNYGHLVRVSATMDMIGLESELRY